MTFFDSTSHVIQLLIALGGAVVLFSLAFAGYARIMFIGLVIMIPFQPISSAYGSFNMAVTYVVGLAMLLNGFSSGIRLKNKIPLLIPFALLYLAFILSWPYSPRMFWSKYMIYLVMVTSNVVLFYMSYTYFRRERDLDTFFKALILSNVLVIVYCLLQLFMGIGHDFTLFGIKELTLNENRWDKRLVGPFTAVGITAEYFVLQSLFLAHYMVRTGRLRRSGYVVLFLNIAMLVATGNRGGFISAILALILFLYFYRRSIGSKGVVAASLAFVVGLGGASFIIIQYTEFNVLYERLYNTEFVGYVPETRVGWNDVVDKIMDRPLIGHGPRIVHPQEYQYSPRNWPAGYISYYPHNLYLFVLYTTGLAGFLAYAVWLSAYWRILRAGSRYTGLKGIGEGLPTLGGIVLAIFLIDQIKVEFLRAGFLDYQNYIAAIFGMFAAYRNIETGKSHIPADGAVRPDSTLVKASGKTTRHAILQFRKKVH